MFSESTQEDIEILCCERCVLICQIHEVSTLLQQRPLFIGDHTGEAGTLEQIVHQEVYILQRRQLMHFTRCIAIDERGLHQCRAHEDRHLLDGHRQTDSGGIGQFTHLHRDSRGLDGIESLNERHNGNLVEIDLRHGYRVIVHGYRRWMRSERCYRFPWKRDCILRHFDFSFSFFDFRSRFLFLRRRNIQHRLQVSDLLLHVGIQIAAKERIGCHMRIEETSYLRES